MKPSFAKTQVQHKASRIRIKAERVKLVQVTAKTPMLQQYFAAKAEHPGVLLAMRVGDFYEFYGDDAETAASVLEITLTSREDGGKRIAMAGVPFHSVEKYLARLVQRGQKVAICDQLEDPKQAKGLVKRGVTRVITPGTLVEDSMLEAGKSNFLAAICSIDGSLGLAVLEPSTGEFSVTEISGAESQERLLQELARLRPAELLIGKDVEAYGELAKSAFGSAISEVKSPSTDRAFSQLEEQFKVSNLKGFGCEDKPVAVVAASMVLSYAEKNHLPLSHLQGLSSYSVDGFMRLDPSTRRSLELTQNLSDGGKRYTLLSILDCTATSMGSRLMRNWVEQPLIDVSQIVSRQLAVSQLIEQAFARGDIRETLKSIADLERLVARCATNLAGPRDLGALRATLISLPKLLGILEPIAFGRIQQLVTMIGNHTELAHQLSAALRDDLPHSVREGGVIRTGYDTELDKLLDLGKDGKQYIAELEQAERASTGIGNLKVGFNSVFGYYIEVSKSQLDKVPSHYIRKQTTANAERYITAELKEHEALVLGASDKANAIEVDLFYRLRMHVSELAGVLLTTARALAEIDVLAAFAETSVQRRYSMPKVTEDDLLVIEVGRHPMVESNSVSFVPNDLDLGPGDNDSRCLVITGPNMAGKSTYLRQIALIVLMAQIGSCVPANSATVGICDRIFARIGAKDELAVGQSTFMVEMVESANILNHATRRSLVILDEVGRGTSTFDGLAIAWAMTEHLADLGAKTLFATHYHQLNELASNYPSIANFRVAVEEIGDEIIWTHRVLPGGTDRSYGIHVARMAGVPNQVLARATDILSELEQPSKPSQSLPVKQQKLQLTLFEAEQPELVRAMETLDVNRLTPLEALRWIDEWKRKITQNNPF